MTRIGTLIGLAAFTLFFARSGSSGDLSPNHTPEQVREEFDRRWKIYRNYIEESGVGSSSFIEPYLTCREFHDLLDMGPVVVPLFARMRGAVSSDAIHVLLRADWGEMAGYGRREAIKINMYEVFDAWWPKAATGEAAILTRDRFVAFRSRLAEAERIGEATNALEWPEWDRLRNMGLLGIPTILDRIRDGKAGEYDFRLMSYWTAPVAYKNDFPIRPVDAPFLPEQNNAQYWLDWWEENGWQYRWLFPKEGG